MGYSSQQLIEYVHSRGYTEQEIADKVGCRQETINRIRRGVPGYHGNRINRKLLKIVRTLQAQEPQEVITPVAAPPQVVTPAWVPKVKQEQVSTPALFYCKSCPFNALIPGGLSAQQTAQWAKANECSNKKSGNCPK